MANNTPKYSNNLRQTLRDIPEDLFDVNKEDVVVKVNLIQKQYTKDPTGIAKLIQRMINEDKRSR